MERPSSRAARRSFIGGSDARIIMGNDEAALLHLWQEKRGEVEPDDLSSNLIVQLGVVTERRFTIPSQIAGLGAASQVFRRIAELEAIAAGGIPVARRSGDRL